MEARETPRLPEDVEAEQRYLAELKAERFQQALSDTVSAQQAAGIMLDDKLAELRESVPPTEQPATLNNYPAQQGYQPPGYLEVDEEALRVLRDLKLDALGEPAKPGVMFRLARYIDDLWASIIKRPTF